MHGALFFEKEKSTENKINIYGSTLKSSIQSIPFELSTIPDPAVTPIFSLMCIVNANLLLFN